MRNASEKNASTKGNQSDRPDLRAEIELRAYHLWRAEGGRHGNALNHWLQAEREITNYARGEKSTK